MNRRLDQVLSTNGDGTGTVQVTGNYSDAGAGKLGQAFPSRNSFTAPSQAAMVWATSRSSCAVEM